MEEIVYEQKIKSNFESIWKLVVDEIELWPEWTSQIHKVSLVKRSGAILNTEIGRLACNDLRRKKKQGSFDLNIVGGLPEDYLESQILVKVICHSEKIHSLKLTFKHHEDTKSSMSKLFNELILQFFEKVSIEAKYYLERKKTHPNLKDKN